MTTMARGPVAGVTKRKKMRDAAECPRCGMLAARVIGRSEHLPVLYVTCEECGRTAIVPSGDQ